MRPDDMRHRFPRLPLYGLLMAALLFAALPALAQDPLVTAADPNQAEQETYGLVVKITGNSFGIDSEVDFFATGTTNPGGIAVRSVKRRNAKTLEATIDVAPDALTVFFDIQVRTGGRTGKGTELFKVLEKTTGTDTIPPGEVYDLTTVEVGFNSATFTWTAPADDGHDASSGMADRYDFRVRTGGPFTEENWNYPTRIYSYQVPAAPGTLDGRTESGLAPETTYWAAIRTSDESGENNPVWSGSQGWSGISNQVMFTTQSCPRPAAWHFEEIAGVCPNGDYTVYGAAHVAFDPTGAPAVLYERRCGTSTIILTLTLARWTGEVWSRETLPIQYYGPTDLAFDPVDGTAMIAAVDGRPSGKSALALYRQSGGAWVGEVLDTGVSSPVLASRVGGPLLAYWVTPRRQPPVLRLAEWTGSGWARNDVPGSAGNKPTGSSAVALALDGEGGVGLLYRMLGDSLRFALWKQGGWTFESVASVGVYQQALAWDPYAGGLAETHSMQFPEADGENLRILLGRRSNDAGGSWQLEPVVDGYWFLPLGLRFDSRGTAYLPYMIPEETVVLARREASDPAWSLDEVLECESGGGAVEVNPLTDELAMAYVRTDAVTGEKALIFARRDP